MYKKRWRVYWKAGIIMLGHFYFENEQAINDQGDVYIIGKTEDEAFTVVSYSKSANDSGELIFDVVAP